MKFVCISDVHIKLSGDLPANLFLKYLKSSQTKESDTVFLLGDIFDLLVGGHEEYIEKHQEIFDEIIRLISEGKRFYHFEGNHDFHFEKLISALLKRNDLPREKWVYLKKPLVLDVGGTATLFAHGDEIEIENLNYKIYKSFIRSSIIKILANYVVPFRIVDSIGQNASKNSRERNVKSYSSETNEYVRDKFRRSFKTAQKKYGVKDVICGHSHCLDNYREDGLYLNNGFFPATRTFTYYDGSNYHQVVIDQPID